MWFKSMQVYRLPAPYSLTPDELAGYPLYLDSA